MNPQTRTNPLSYQRLSYVKLLLELALLLFALPWVIRELFRDPMKAGAKLAGAKKPMAS